MAKTLANQLVGRYEKYGTITDRDYELESTGEGMNTRYSLTPEPASKVRISKYKALDLLAILEEQHAIAMGEALEDEDEDDTPAPVKRPVKRPVEKVVRKRVRRA